MVDFRVGARVQLYTRAGRHGDSVLASHWGTWLTFLLKEMYEGMDNIILSTGVDAG